MGSSRSEVKDSDNGLGDDTNETLSNSLEEASSSSLLGSLDGFHLGETRLKGVKLDSSRAQTTSRTHSQTLKTTGDTRSEGVSTSGEPVAVERPVEGQRRARRDFDQNR